jgi:hypothetical protein
LALRYIFELLVKNTNLRLPVGQFALQEKFGRNLSYIIQRTAAGTQEIRVDSHYLAVTNQFGFLVDFHFRPKDPRLHSRETQRLSLSLDERYRSNKNAYIDREKIVKQFVATVFSGIFPLSHPNLSQPLGIAQSFANLRTSVLPNGKGWSAMGRSNKFLRPLGASCSIAEKIVP